MSNYGIIRERVQQCLEEGWKKFIVFPFGENGMLAKHVLEQAFGITELLIVDNELAKYNKTVLSVDALNCLTGLENYALLIASVNPDIVEYGHQNIPCKKAIDIVPTPSTNLSANPGG